MLRFLAGADAARTPAALRRLLHVGAAAGGGETGSVAYRMSMLRRPPSVKKEDLDNNSCSLIGRLAAPVRPYDGSRDEYPRAYSFLAVSPSSSASSSSSSKFWVTLQLNGELASVGLKHLKPNDLVYVSGLLRSYHKVYPCGGREIIYKICVDELNYVLDQNKKPQNDADSMDPSSASTPSVTPEMQKENEYIDRVRLWQVFFANPYEWWDNRQGKPHFKCADFKHKDTREKLWLHPDDPPWVRKQLELHDLEIAEHGHKGRRQPLKNHDWKAQDFEDYSDDDEVQHSAEA